MRRLRELLGYSLAMAGLQCEHVKCKEGVWPTVSV